MTILWSGHDNEGNTVSGSFPVTVSPRPILVPAQFGDGTNRAADLNAWIAAQPNGSRLDFAGISIRADQTVVVTKTGVSLYGGTIYTNDPTGDSSTLAAPSGASRSRAHVKLLRSTSVTCDLTIRGPHAGGGVDTAAYVEPLEAQHGYEIAGGSGNTVRGEVSYVYGDCVYAGNKAVGVTVDVHGHHNGRQGVSGCDVVGMTIAGTLHDIRRSLVDLEPATDSWRVDGVLIADLRVGKHRLTGATASASVGVVSNVTVRNVRDMDDQITNFQIQVGHHDNPHRQGPWDVRDVVMRGAYGTTAGYMAKFIGIDGVAFHATDMPMQNGRGMALVGTHDCTAVDVSGNRISTILKDKTIEPGDAVEYRTF